MTGSKKLLVLFICISFLSLQLPNPAMAGYYAKANTGVTAKPPQALSTPEEDIPIVEVSKEEKKGGKTWMYIAAGVVVVGLLGALAAGGGGSSGGGSSDGDDPPPDGGIGVSW